MDFTQLFYSLLTGFVQVMYFFFEHYNCDWSKRLKWLTFLQGIWKAKSVILFILWIFINLSFCPHNLHLLRVIDVQSFPIHITSLFWKQWTEFLSTGFLSSHPNFSLTFLTSYEWEIKQPLSAGNIKLNKLKN